GEDVGRHLPDPPGAVTGGGDDRRGGLVVPGVQQAAGRPDPGPVAVRAAVVAGQHVAGRLAAQNQDEAAVGLAAPEQRDAARYELRLPALLALVQDALPR